MQKRSALAALIVALLLASGAAAQRIVPSCNQQLVGIGNCIPSAGATGIALVATASASSPDGNSVTTSAINTTGANLIVVSESYQGTLPVLTDSSSNTWNHLTTHSNVVLWYCSPCTVSGSQTFTVNGPFQNPAVSVVAFSGVASSSPLDQQNGAACGGFSCQTGSVPPTLSGEVVVSGLMVNATETEAVDSGLTISSQAPKASGFGTAIAYLVQASASAVNPTWSGANNAIRAGAIASFKAR